LHVQSATSQKKAEASSYTIFNGGKKKVGRPSRIMIKRVICKTSLKEERERKFVFKNRPDILRNKYYKRLGGRSEILRCGKGGRKDISRHQEDRESMISSPSRRYGGDTLRR